MACSCDWASDSCSSRWSTYCRISPLRERRFLAAAIFARMRVERGRGTEGCSAGEEMAAAASMGVRELPSSSLPSSLGRADQCFGEVTRGLARFVCLMVPEGVLTLACAFPMSCNMPPEGFRETTSPSPARLPEGDTFSASDDCCSRLACDQSVEVETEEVVCVGVTFRGGSVAPLKPAFRSCKRRFCLSPEALPRGDADLIGDKGGCCESCCL